MAAEAKKGRVQSTRTIATFKLAKYFRKPTRKFEDLLSQIQQPSPACLFTWENSLVPRLAKNFAPNR